jgi:hypothetical protein
MTSSQAALNIQLWFIHTCFYEFLCIIKVYSIGIPKSENIQNLKLFWIQAFQIRDTKLQFTYSPENVFEKLCLTLLNCGGQIKMLLYEVSDTLAVLQVGWPGSLVFSIKNFLPIKCLLF